MTEFKQGNEPVPQPPQQTIRRTLVALLKQRSMDVKALSKEVGKSEKEIVAHLEHIGRSYKLSIEPAQCYSCGYVFNDRKKIGKPSKCPQCRGSNIDEPLYRVLENI